MTKKKEKQPRGRPSKKKKEIFADDGADLAKATPPTPKKTASKPQPAAPEKKDSVPVHEEKLDLSQPEKPQALNGPDKDICAKCKTELIGKPKYCPGCSIELDWGA